MVTQISVELSGVTVERRRTRILGPIDLKLPGTGFTIVLGPNGSGKTTFLKVVHGVERVTHGTVEWSTPEHVARSAQSYVFQTPVMLRRSVRENLAYPLKLTGAARSEIDSRVKTWADHIGLADALDRAAPRLSGGERQKLALGRALIREPKVLFLDEPCANLDGKATREIEALLLTAHSNGTRVIMTSHDIGQAKRLASDVLFLLAGRIHDKGPGPEFFAGPKTEEAQAFLRGDIVE